MAHCNTVVHCTRELWNGKETWLIKWALELLLSPFPEEHTVVPRQPVNLLTGSSLGLGVIALLVLSSGSLLGSPRDEEGAAALGGSSSGSH